MIKYFLIFVFLIWINSSCKYFDDCDGLRYQIKEKKELGNGLCKYRAQSITNCLVWNDQKFLEFTDSCSIYYLSEIRDRKEFYMKYGI